MERINIENNGFIYPMPVALLGTNVENKANFMALGRVMRANANPPMLTAAVNKNHLTNEAIRENKTFSVNFPSIDMIEKTDYCSSVSGRREDKSELFKTYTIEFKTAPIKLQNVHFHWNVSCTIFMKCLQMIFLLVK